MDTENQMQVVRVGDRYGAEINGNIARTFDSLQEAIQYVTAARQGLELW